MQKKLLDGIRVLDLTRVFAGPAATQVLGDLGADIVKLEPPAGDEARYYGVSPEQMAELGMSPSFIAYNRNKRSITIDMRAETGKALARRMALKSDVIVSNFRPGVMERMGLGYEDIVADNPSVIYAEFSAYGRSGALAQMGANDLALQAHSGLISITGEPDRAPVRCGTAVVDIHGSLALVSGILAALLYREKTGQGQRVESSLLMSSAHLMGHFYTEYWMTGIERAPMGTANHLTVPNQAFPAADGEVVLIASTDDQWQRFAQALDAETLDIPAFAKVFDRRQNREMLVEAVSKVTRNLPSEEILRRLSKAKVVAAKVNSIGKAASSPQLDAIGGRVRLTQRGHEVPTIASPFSLSAQDMSEGKPAPDAGQDTVSILGDYGLTAEEIDTLITSGALGDVATAPRERSAATTG